jgi:hypothetical protein
MWAVSKNWHKERYCVNHFLTANHSVFGCFGLGKRCVRVELVPTPAFLSFILGRRAMPVGARWSNGMSGRPMQAEPNLVLAFALTIASAVGVGLPMALLIILLCS